MRVEIVTAGSRGDVAPYTGLGQALRAAGHQVTLTTHDNFTDLVTGAGLDFRPLPGDPYAAQRTTDGQRLHRHGGSLRGTVEFARQGRRYLDALGDGLLDVGVDADLLLLATTTAPLGYSVAQRRGIPSIGVFLQPVAPTGDFPPVLLGDRSWGRRGNRLLGLAGAAVSARAYDRASRRLRRRLGLPPVSLARLLAQAERANWPVLHGVSPSVLPRPTDWRRGLEMVGYWWPASDPGWTPPPELTEFLRAGPPPVLITFGSMAVLDPQAGPAIGTALRRAGVRAVVQAGWGDLRVASDDALPIGEVPHDWLMPRVAAVVHHAGAGTTAAALRAGVPSVTVPAIADQPFWAARLVRLGVGAEPIPARRLTADRLADAIRTVVHRPEYAERARRLAARIAAEDGCAEVLAALP
ncbi:glycosyltransferase [Micromonospora sp. NBC_01813]|uniref:glycosyltransferase n=1 Tax=Micromonospora sp. NBC_01813 TaxID=2975988 RepID=UPI002DDB8B54|nr:glycosyltransferase [Micromonospora sp. NBC_01813]WSA09840.1 glycosyltransferase [Micromonospora sp. NBC_01813]